MDRVLSSFIRALRAAGAQVSSAEAIDAANAMALVGYASRPNLKAALAVSLAKTEEEKEIFESVFDLFFSLPPETVDGPQSGSSGQAAHPPTGNSELDSLLDHIGNPSAPENLQRMLANAAAQVGVDDIRFSSQVPYFTGRLMKAMGAQALEDEIQKLAIQADAGAPGQLPYLTETRDALQARARAWVKQRYELFGKPSTDAFLTDVAVNRPIGRMSPPDMARMKVAVARMAKRLAARHSHRQRILLRGKLDLRRTLRANAGHDGMPFDLVFKHKRRDKPRMVAICDVSGSVAQNVRFLLLFLYALQEVVSDLRVFAFSNHLRDIARPLETLPFEEAMALILKEVGSGSTDYGQAWADLHQQHWQAIDRRTTVLVMGDGRSNGTPPRLDIFNEMVGRAKRVVWLCPETPGRWGSGDSDMLLYRTLATHVSHCATVADLDRAMDEALSVYG